MRRLLLRIGGLFNSVPFGISLMVLIGLYIALGSGIPRLREWLEMDEMAFFNAWPFKLLMLLLVVNLATVTVRRIPFTPPRWGVWCIHSGIIVLIAGMASYYRNKVEGLAIIPVGSSADHFYDNTERALYMRLEGMPLLADPLPNLPRFKVYDDLGGRFKGLIPRFVHRDGVSQQPTTMTLARAMKLPDELQVDVLSYFPYAVIQDFAEDPQASTVGLKLTSPDGGAAQWLVESDPRNRAAALGDIIFAHRHLTPEKLTELKQAAQHVHRLKVSVKGNEKEIYVSPGATYKIDGTSYSLQIERFDPSWGMFGSNDRVKALTMLVTVEKPEGKTQYRRMVLDGKDVQTDFKLDEPGAPPMGQRQKEPLDKDLTIRYAFADPEHLYPAMGREQHTLVTTADSGVTRIATSSSAPPKVEVLADSAQISLGDRAETARVTVYRTNHVRRVDRIVEVPKSQRRPDPQGTFQVLRVRVRMGDWSQDLAVPYARWANESPQWQPASVRIPGNGARLEFQLGNLRRPLPARIMLEKFELIPYPGGDMTNGPFRDFKSTLRIENPATGKSYPDIAHLNEPVYYGGWITSDWTFFQAEWDPEGQSYTVLGIGTRSGVLTMTGGSVMIVLGLLWAFYVKPIMIRRMKRKAMAGRGHGQEDLPMAHGRTLTPALSQGEREKEGQDYPTDAGGEEAQTS